MFPGHQRTAGHSGLSYKGLRMSEPIANAKPGKYKADDVALWVGKSYPLPGGQTLLIRQPSHVKLGVFIKGKDADGRTLKDPRPSVPLAAEDVLTRRASCQCLLNGRQHVSWAAALTLAGTLPEGDATRAAIETHARNHETARATLGDSAGSSRKVVAGDLA